MCVSAQGESDAGNSSASWGATESSYRIDPGTSSSSRRSAEAGERRCGSGGVASEVRVRYVIESAGENARFRTLDRGNLGVVGIVDSAK